jgi:hypothetical protein
MLANLTGFVQYPTFSGVVICCKCTETKIKFYLIMVPWFKDFQFLASGDFVKILA